MKIFIAGASGYIGEAVSLALRRRGHVVYGLSRSAEKGRNLTLNEVNVVIGDALKPETYKEAASKCDVLIQLTSDFQNFEAADSVPLEAFLDIGKSQPGSKLVIYTSGILVYSADKKYVHSEEDPVDPNFMFGGRINRENAVLHSNDVFGVVVRPGFTYGQKSNPFEIYFKNALEGKVVVFGEGTVHSKIHIDDLADAYVRIVEASRNVVKGEIFNVADDCRATDIEIAKRFASLAGYHGEITVDEKGGFPFLKKSVLVSARKATRVLGWTPKHLQLLDEAELHFAVFKARNNL